MSSHDYNILSLHLLLKYCAKYVLDDTYVYKLCYDILTDENIRKWFVVMKKIEDTKSNENRPDIFDNDHAKFRANKLMVIEIVDVDDPSIKKDFIINKYDTTKTKYEVGKDVESDRYDEETKNICSNGIHYFKTPTTAYYYRSVPYNYTGHWIEWQADGRQSENGQYLNRQKVGKWSKWCDFKKEYLEVIY